MGLGVLESRTAIVQGTIQLLEGHSADHTHDATNRLKHSKDGKIVLSPQPSDDPNDPLNWPKWRRDTSFALICIMGVLSLLHGPILAPVTVDLAIQFNKSINDIAQLSTYMLLVLCGSAYVWNVWCQSFGKRSLFLFCGAVLVAADAWAASATSYNSLLQARILSGLGQSAFEAMNFAIITDLFFVHERGKRIAMAVFMGSTGISLGVPIATQIATKYGGYPAMFKGLAIAEAIVLVAIFFLFEECAYPKSHIDVLAHKDEATNTAEKQDDSVLHKDEPVAVEIVSTSDSTPVQYVKRSYLSTLNPWSGRIYQHNL